MSGGLSEPASVLFPRPLELSINTAFSTVPQHKDPVLLQQKYVVEGRSIRQIAAELLSSKEAVRQGLITAGIPLRLPHLPHHGRQSQPKFGYRRNEGKVIEMKVEQKIVDAVTAMKARGLSLRQIAETLTQLGISTKRRGQRWHPEMVSRMLCPESKGVPASETPVSSQQD